MLCQALLAITLLCDVDTYFSPEDDLIAQVVKSIETGPGPILVQAHSFASHEIAQALVVVAKRPAHVVILLDERAAKEKGSQATYCQLGGCAVRVDDKHAFAQSTIIVGWNPIAKPQEPQPRAILFTGSFNLTDDDGEPRAENLLKITNDAATIRRYYENWEQHYLHTDNFDPAKSTNPPVSSKLKAKEAQEAKSNFLRQKKRLKALDDQQKVEDKRAQPSAQGIRTNNLEIVPK